MSSSEENSTPPASTTISSLGRTLNSVVDAGRIILAKRRLVSTGKADSNDSLVALCKELLEHRGEASGMALAIEIIEAYTMLDDTGRLAFFKSLAADFEVDGESILHAADAYRENPDTEHLWAIARTVEAPRQKLFRRLNMAPDGTRTLVTLRGQLLAVLRSHPELRGVDSDLKHLFISWFNKGFLELRRIDWSSPALVLEKLIDYEAVHEINGWDDLRSRLGQNRCCFAFFHPALQNDPLVFVEVALTEELPSAIAPLLHQEREHTLAKDIDTVVFYSISNCHPGLAGVSFGNFLIKNVVQELKKENPTLKTFVTLSPVPGYRKWLRDADLEGLVSDTLIDQIKRPVSNVVRKDIYDAHISLCAHYLLNEKSGDQPRDPVARFHLGNGARLHRIHGGADLSTKGREQSAGIMVNYLYDLSKIEANHEAFFDEGQVVASRSVTRLVS